MPQESDLDMFYGYPLSEVIRESIEKYKGMILAEVVQQSVPRKRRRYVK
jgi:hypothetical protein